MPPKMRYTVETFIRRREAWVVKAQSLETAEDAVELATHMAANFDGVIVTEVDESDRRTVLRVFGEVPKDAVW